MATLTRAFIGLGGNVGHAAKTFARALASLHTRGVRPGLVSGVYRTSPVGPVAQADYLNAAAEVWTALDARCLLEQLLGVERELGRDRSSEVRWGPRTIDLDLLLFGKKEIHDAGLVVPHPRLAERLFVLVPLAEIAGSVVVPGATSTVRELRARLGRVCTDRVERVRTPAP